MNINPYKQYKTVNFATDNQILLMIEFIEEGIKKLYEGRKCLEEENIEGKYLAFEKARQIFFSLTHSDLSEEDKKTLAPFNNFFLQLCFKISQLHGEFMNTEEVTKIIESV